MDLNWFRHLLGWCSLILITACSYGQKFYSHKNASKEKVTMYIEKYPGCDYIKVSKTVKGTRLYDLYVEFNCHESMPVYLRKSTYDAKGKYLYTWHTVTENGATLKMMGAPLISSLQKDQVRSSFVPVTAEDIDMLKNVAAQLARIQYKHRLEPAVIDKIIGWINASKGG